MSKRNLPQYRFLKSFSAGAIPFLSDSMSYRVTENEQVDLQNVYQRPSLPPMDTKGGTNYEENITLVTTPEFKRSKSDLNLVTKTSVSESSSSPDGYVEPTPLEYSSKSMIPMAHPRYRTRKTALALPPVPPRPSRESQTGIVVDGVSPRLGSETSPYDISKSIAESAMDISLLTANANQLRLLITYNQGSQTYLACITFIIMSLVLQMLVAVTMIIVSLAKQNLRETTRQKMKIINSVGVAVITMINILVASLVVAEQGPNAIPMATATATIMEILPTVASTTTTAAPLITSTIASTTASALLEGDLSSVAAAVL